MKVREGGESEREGGGRPSRNRKRPTDHAGAYPRARAFPAVPPSPPLVMQRHGILSRDGEAARRILVPQIDFTLHSPSGRYESFHTTRTLVDYSFRPGETASVWAKNLLGRWKSPIPGRAFQSSLRICEMGAKQRPSETPGTGKSKAGEGVGSLDFGPSSRGLALASKLARQYRMPPPSNQKNESQSATTFYK